MYSKINITATVAIAVAAVLFLVLTSCAKPHVHNKDTRGNAHVEQVEAEKRLRDALVLVTR
jgi:hypothetical protein